MKRLFSIGQRVLVNKRGLPLIRYQIRSYSLPYEVAEKIKSQLDFKDARLLMPENSGPSSVYKGLVILAAGPIAKYPALRKLSEPYLEFGLPVVTLSRNLISWGFCSPAQQRMNRVFNVVSANLTEPCPVVMKQYCSGAYASFPAAAREFSRPGCKLKLSGTIFDSGPPKMTPKDAIDSSNFFALQKRYPTLFHRVKELLIPLTLVTINGSRKRSALERMMFGPFLHHIPQLYVYSTADDLMHFDYVNKLIDSQLQHNADVTKYIFNDTLHMLHRSKHPMEYDNLLLDFLKKKCNLPI